MISVHKAADRGRTGTYWLDSRHSFSFADYVDPARMGFGPLRVINEDWVAPAAGFDTHPHRDMEILTYVLEGALAHRDSMGNGSTIRPGEVQVMSAGTGVAHSERNPSTEAPVHLLQIWLQPDRRGLTPSYAQKDFGAELDDRLRLVASPDGADGSLVLHQDATLRAGRLAPRAAVAHAVASGRRVWVQVARGAASLNGTALDEGDGAAIEGVDSVALRAGPEGAEVLVFDMA